MRDYARELVPDVAGYRSSTGQAGIKWNPKEAYGGVSAVQMTGSPKGLVLGKDLGAQRLRQREQMSMLMMADREMAEAELLSFRNSSESEDCLHHMDDLQVSAWDRNWLGVWWHALSQSMGVCFVNGFLGGVSLHKSRIFSPCFIFGILPFFLYATCHVERLAAQNNLKEPAHAAASTLGPN